MSSLEAGGSGFGFSLKCLEPEVGASGCGCVPSWVGHGQGGLQLGGWGSSVDQGEGGTGM